MTESMNALYVQHARIREMENEVLEKMKQISRQDDMSARMPIVEYDGYYTGPELKMIIYGATPPTMKKASKSVYGTNYQKLYEQDRAVWREYIQRAKRTIEDKEGRKIVSFEKAIVGIKFMEEDAFRRDCDNYAIGLINNALTINDILVDDCFDRMRFLYDVSGEKSQDYYGTLLYIVENDGHWKTGNCNKCKINQMIESQI